MKRLINVNPSNPVPPRKRTERACDQCKRRKTKCSGGKTCNQCLEIGLTCGYGERLKQVRGPSYVAHLENQVRELQARVALHEPNYVHQAAEAVNTPPTSASPRSDSIQDTSDSSMRSSTSGSGRIPPANDVSAMGFQIPESSPFEATWNDSHPISTASQSQTPCNKFLLPIPGGQEAGHSNSLTACYYGNSSGLEILRRMRAYLDEITGLRSEGPVPSGTKLTNALDRPLPIHNAFRASVPDVLWPSRDSLLKSVEIVFDDIFSLWPVIDRSSVDSIMDNVYNSSYPARTDNRSDQLAVLFAMSALSERIQSSGTKQSGFLDSGNEFQDLAYFKAARHFVNPSECHRSLMALQATVCMVLYEVASSSISMAHSDMGNATAAAIQMGLSKSHHSSRSPSPEAREREQLYRTLQALDIYISSLLGLSRRLPSSEPMFYQPSSSFSGVNIAEGASQLFHPLGDMLEATYFSSQNGDPGPSRERIRHFCNKLDDQRRDNLLFMRPNSGNTAVKDRRQCMLFKAVHGYVQMLATSPFLLYLTNTGHERDEDGYRAATKCIDAALETVESSKAMTEQGLINEAYPCTLQGLIFAAVSLLMAQLTGADHPVWDRLCQANKDAAHLLEGLAAESTTARECLDSLQPTYCFMEATQSWITNEDYHPRSMIIPKDLSLDVGLMQDWLIPAELATI